MIWIANCINTFFVTEYVDMFPQTNGDILLQSILVWIGSQKLTSIRMYRAMLRLCACCQGKINKCQKAAYFRAFFGGLDLCQTPEKARLFYAETYLLQNVCQV